MKAIYQSPKTVIITIEVSKMIAASDLIKSNNGVLEQDLSNPQETNVTSGNLSRRNNIWDDEEIDEEY